MEKPELCKHLPAIQNYVMLYLCKKRFVCGVTPNAGLAAAEIFTRDSAILWTLKMPHHWKPTAAADRRSQNRPSLCGLLHHPRSALLLLATTKIAVGYFILEPPMHLFLFLSISTSVRLPHSRHLRLASTSPSSSPSLHPIIHCPSSIDLIDIDAMNCTVQLQTLHFYFVLMMVSFHTN